MLSQTPKQEIDRKSFIGIPTRMSPNHRLIVAGSEVKVASDQGCLVSHLTVVALTSYTYSGKS